MTGTEPRTETIVEQNGIEETPDAVQIERAKSTAARMLATDPDSLSANGSSLVYQDMAFPIQSLLEAETPSESGVGALTKTGQVKTNGWKIPQSAVSQIRVCNSVSSLTTSTVNAALDEWNSTGSNVGFLFAETVPCAITIEGVSGTGFSDEQYPVQAEFGVNRVGKFIRVAPNFGTRYTNGNQILTLMHALGHTIGFGHANSSEESTSRHIASTPTNDRYSIMATAIWYNWVIPPAFPGGTAQSGAEIWNVLLPGDKMAARILYPMNMHQQLSQVSDANGDGKPDVIIIGDNGVTVALQNSTGKLDEPKLWTTEFSSNWDVWDFTIHPRYLADVNGDGKTDVIGFGTYGVYVALSTGTKFAPIGVFWNFEISDLRGWNNPEYIKTIVDVTGDGKADLVAIGANEVVVRPSTGSSFAGGGAAWSEQFAYNDGWRKAHHVRTFADVNGDGKADLVGIGYNETVIAFSTGTSFTQPVLGTKNFHYNQGWRNEDHVRMIADVNGDSKADLVGMGYNETVIALSTGANFSDPILGTKNFHYNQGWRNGDHIRTLADVNGDKKADIIGFGYNETVIALSTGAGFSDPILGTKNFYSNQGWGTPATPRLIADFNNDGKADIIGLGYNEFMLGLSDGTKFNVSLGLQYRTY